VPQGRRHKTLTGRPSVARTRLETGCSAVPIGSDVANDRDSSQIQAQGGPGLLLAARGRRSLAMQTSIVGRVDPRIYEQD